MTVRRRQISSRACRSANCVSKAVIDYLVQQKVPETLVSEIVRPSPETAQLLSVRPSDCLEDLMTPSRPRSRFGALSVND